MQNADRLAQLPPYLFREIDRKKREAVAAGRDVIDLGVGDPDLPTPGFIVDRMAKAIRHPANHRYAPGSGMAAFRQAGARYLARRFGIQVDPACELLALLGSKEGIGHLPIAVVNPGDTVLVPDPGYPVYTSGAVFAGASCHIMPLRAEYGWLPVLDDIPIEVRRRATLMWLNYPNNPTAAIAPLSFFEEAIALAREYNILIAHDAPYCELYYDDPPPSILQVEGALEVAVEFHSLSKTFNMTGWRIGFVVGHREVLAALARVKSNLDSGVFQAIQHAGVVALDGMDRPEIRTRKETYLRRRDVLVAGLREAGWSVETPKATFYVWAKCPQGRDSMAVASRVLDEVDVVVIPGAGFGSGGEGYVRLALTVSERRMKEAAGRLATLSW